MVLEGGTNPGKLSKTSSGRRSSGFSGNWLDRSAGRRRLRPGPHPAMDGGLPQVAARGSSGHLRVNTWYTTKAGHTTDFMKATSTSQNVPECVWR